MNANTSTLVVIEDDPQIRRFLRTGLSTEPFRIFEAETGRAGLVEAATRKPDLVILDLGLPDLDGVEVVSELRQWYTRPIIILSARSNEQEKIKALDAGADDYLTKPFGIGELLARLRAALRRAARDAGVAAENSIEFGDVRVDLAARRVQRAGSDVHLTPNEYRLLAALVRHAGKVCTHRQLLAEVWGPSHVEHGHYLRIYMAQLRHKLELDPTNPRFLRTEAGVGYRLLVD
ncbi:MAG TPA: two-component system response regulator KdpE [Casimicrobiaceae bacterium]|nr:two-component system response regulator KdpE [Casimicrobiaceae bacterium]